MSPRQRHWLWYGMQCVGIALDACQAEYLKDSSGGGFEPNPNQTPMALFEGASEFTIQGGSFTGSQITYQLGSHDDSSQSESSFLVYLYWNVSYIYFAPHQLFAGLSKRTHL